MGSSRQNKFEVSLGSSGNVKIFADKRLIEMDHGPLKAYEAKKTILGESIHCFALVCDRNLLPRSALIENYMPIMTMGMHTLIEDGVSFWPPEEKECYIFVYERTLIARKMVKEEADDIALGLSPRIVMDKVIPVFIKALQRLERAGISHGSICLSNIYGAYESDKLIDITLGDMLTLPYGYMQPSLYKTPPKMLTDKLGCGRGTIADDIYAFGVSLALMLRTKDPFTSKKSKDILLSKMKSGTYTTLIENERFGSSYLELLKGILHDDADKRWTVEEISLWYDGRKLSPKQFMRAKEATRPLEFNGEKYEQVALLAKDLARNPVEAGTLIDNGQLAHWLERSLGSIRTFERYEKAKEAIKGNLKPADRNQVITAAVATSLNPKNPIMYKGLAFYPSALADIINEICYQERDINIVVDIIKSGIITNWFMFQLDNVKDLSSQIKEFENCIAAIRNGRIGYGPERCAYILAKHAPCYSLALKKYYVQDSDAFIQVVEKLAEAGQISFDKLMDRHIAAFLAERNPKVIDKALYDLGEGVPAGKIIATLSVYASLQKYAKQKSCKHIAHLFLKKLTPCYNMFNDRDLREDLEKKARKIADKGDLQEILNLFIDTKLRNRDRYAFLAANERFKRLDAERIELEKQLKDKQTFGRAVGRDFSAMTATVISAIICVMVVINFFAGG